MLDAEETKLWFQVYLPLFLPSIDSNTFQSIQGNISCDSYQEMWVKIMSKCQRNVIGWKDNLLDAVEWKNFCCLYSVMGCNNVFSQLSMWQIQQVFSFIMDYLLGHSSSGILGGIMAQRCHRVCKNPHSCFVRHVQFKVSLFLFPGFSCVQSINDDRSWLVDNFGQFRVEASYVDFVTLKSNFNGVSDDILSFVFSLMLTLANHRRV